MKHSVAPSSVPPKTRQLNSFEVSKVSKVLKASKVGKVLKVSRESLKLLNASELSGVLYTLEWLGSRL